MSIHSSLWPQAHCAMYFCDMIIDSVRFAGLPTALAMNAVFSALEICVADCEAISLFRALTKSMCAEMPFRYAVSAEALSPERYAASALTNCSCAYVMNGKWFLSSKMYRLDNPEPAVPT